ncbi:MAG: SDR family oxidoreductase [Acidimicrobiales bacterium]
MARHNELAGQSAVVTGASSGIGRAIAERLGAEGLFVVLAGRDEASLAQSAQRITESGGRALAVATDLRSAAAVQGLVDECLRETGRLDVFVNCAGVMYLGTIVDAELDQWRTMLDTNVFALLVGCQAAIKAMRAGGRAGHIVNLSSVAALSPSSGVYGATKHAVNVITETLRAELLNDPIKVTTIMPGVTATNMARHMDPTVVQGFIAMSGVDAEFRPGERLPEEVLEKGQAALNELMIKPDDVAESVMFALKSPVGVHIAEIVVRPNKDLDIG